MKFFYKDGLLLAIKKVVKEAMQEYDSEARRGMISPTARYLTRQQAADYLSVSVKTIDAWARQGRLKRIYKGNTPRFDREEIDRSFNDLQRYRRAS